MEHVCGYLAREEGSRDTCLRTRSSMRSMSAVG